MAVDLPRRVDAADTVVLVPRGIELTQLTDLDDAAGLPLAGGPAVFQAVEVRLGAPTGPVLPVAAVGTWVGALAGDGAAAVQADWAALQAPRPAWLGLAMDVPRLMGVVNVTPDSFSDGGRYDTVQAAVDHGKALLDAGADILDIGGESTRPGADPVPPDVEQARILPVIAALADTGAPITVDTRHAATMRAALAAGAGAVNDVMALTGDGALAAAAPHPVALMHAQGDPRTMQDDPRYGDVTAEVLAFLRVRVAAARSAGIPAAAIAVDPGFGFGKTAAHNLTLMRDLATFHALGCPILVGLSRKSLVAKVSRGEPADRRLPGSLALAIEAVRRGAQIVRVHDVAETRQALALAQAAWTGDPERTD